MIPRNDQRRCHHETLGLARSLWDKGWPATAQPGRAENGPVTVLSVPVSRHDEARLHHDVRCIAPAAVWTTKDLRAPNLVHQRDKPKRLRAAPTRCSARFRIACSTSRCHGL
jgi:hypothetical protein